MKVQTNILDVDMGYHLAVDHTDVSSYKELLESIKDFKNAFECLFPNTEIKDVLSNDNHDDIVLDFLI